MDPATRSAPPDTLLLHDGELADVRGLLCDLGAPFVERLGALPAEDAEQTWALVVATPQRILDTGLDTPRERPTQIVVYDRGSRTLRSSLRRAGVQLLVRRPVHPAALRGLILHALYRGPEKRRTTRVSIGAPVRFRSGLRRRSAILADLSLGGCRLLGAPPAQPGRAITLCIPAEVAGGRRFRVRARVLRRASDDGAEPGFSARFEGLSRRQVESLKHTLAAHARGPATIDAGEAARARADAGAAADGAGAGAPPVPADRRAHPRREISRRVIALDEQATRILMGRDISPGGMRVDRNPLLSIGRDVRLAVHVGDRDRPLVLVAKVHRDDGERGMVLRFHQLDPSAARVLNRLLERLPVIGSDESEQGVGMIVSEILEPAAGPGA